MFDYNSIPESILLKNHSAEIEKNIIDKINNAKDNMFSLLGITVVNKELIIKSLSNINPLDENRKNKICKQLMEMTCDLKEVTYNKAKNPWKSFRYPEKIKEIIRLLDRHKYYTRFGEFSTLDLLYTTQSIEKFSKNFHKIVNFYSNDLRQICDDYSNLVIERCDDIKHFFHDVEYTIIRNLPYVCKGVFCYVQVFPINHPESMYNEHFHKKSAIFYNNDSEEYNIYWSEFNNFKNCEIFKNCIWFSDLIKIYNKKFMPFCHIQDLSW
jgi:hypothetical protein